jgi:hypothetical protein
MIKYYGWYDGIPKSNGNLVLSYWNHVVNEYPVVGDSPNDVSRYSKENYVLSIKKFMDLHTESEHTRNRKFIIDIPINEVYHNGQITAEDGYPENVIIWKTSDWIEYVVKELENDDRIIGWYHADEPEVWGYREVVNGNVVNTNPTIPYQFLKERYDLIKSISSKLVFSIFCDVPLFNKRYYNDIKNNGAFYDVFMFDYYPYTLDYKYPTWSKITDFVEINNELHSEKMIVYVGQGSGSPMFNTRVPIMDEHQRMYVEFCKNVPTEKRFGYLLWSHSWADEVAKYRGNLTLTENLLKLWEDDIIKQPIEPEKPVVVVDSIITKIIKFIKRLFR